ncbi:putative gamma-glutamyltranspeptidase [Lyophyllum shimeji]|uniref:Glutathione hydrolase n=1 Tax=Lyophyllum shimeji TaxID=47721 RepID=A0A9P3PJ15_LYOSH|nr:putative gamma-glutamyltranspeptidase [Lyophyllum shimeji]
MAEEAGCGRLSSLFAISRKIRPTLRLLRIMGNMGIKQHFDASGFPSPKLPLYADDIPELPKEAWPRWRSFLLGIATLGLCALLWSARSHDHRIYDHRRSYDGHENPAYLIKAKYGAVASENKRCSDIGVQILKEGGNAVDAAIGATFCTGVVNMFSSGLGGGGLMTVRLPPPFPGGHSEVYTIDFREVAPALANSSMFHRFPELAKFGGLAVAVPGEVLGLEEAHRRWGKLPWQRLVRPSIELARGWRVDRELGRRIPWFSELMLNNPDWSAIFAPNGILLREGDVIRRTNLSRTLGLVARDGSSAFYQGPIGDSLVRKVRSTGGILSHADLRNYSVKVRPALRGTYRGKKVYTTHAPTSGPVLIHMLNLLEKYDVTERDVLLIHRVVEIIKFGFAARTKICDPDFNNNTARMDIIPTKEYANLIAKNITDDRTHPAEYYNPEYDTKPDHGTSHTSVLDRDGMAVAVTSTVNLVFGSRVLDPETGIILNDEMDDFSIPGVPNGFGLWPSPYNYPAPGKRPLSSTAPTILEDQDGSFYVALGGSGGSRIFPSVFQVLLNLELGLDLSAAIEYGRVHDQLYPPVLDVDDIYPRDIVKGLRTLGHNVTILDVNRVAGVIQAVAKIGGTIFAASDSRKNGIAAGF